MQRFVQSATEVVMLTDINSTPASLAIAGSNRLVAAVFAAAFGALLLFGVGFAQSDVLHNAAHDSRHAAGFPCH
jgi:cobalt transporter subunit CbtB